MTSELFQQECARQFKQYFSLLKQHKVDTDLKNRIQGFINAGEFMNLITRQEASQLMEQAHISVFGITTVQRQAAKASIKSALNGDDEVFFDIPAIKRKSPPTFR